MKKTKKFGIVSFRMPINEKQQVEQIALSEFRSVSQWIYKLIKTELNHRRENATQTKLD